MLQDDRDNLELQRLMNETRKLAAERQKLLAEAKKLERETNLYPLAVLGGVVTAITAVAGVFHFWCSALNRAHDPKGNQHDTFDRKAMMNSYREHDNGLRKWRIKDKDDVASGGCGFGIFCIHLDSSGSIDRSSRSIILALVLPETTLNVPIADS